jgi:hypothetical protein
MTPRSGLSSLKFRMWPNSPELKTRKMNVEGFFSPTLLLLVLSRLSTSTAATAERQTSSSVKMNQQKFCLFSKCDITRVVGTRFVHTWSLSFYPRGLRSERGS